MVSIIIERELATGRSAGETVFRIIPIIIGSMNP